MTWDTVRLIAGCACLVLAGFHLGQVLLLMLGELTWDRRTVLGLYGETICFALFAGLDLLKDALWP